MVSIKHKKVLSIGDDPDASNAGQVLPSDWNDDHSVSLDSADIITAGGVTSASLATGAQLGDLTVAGSSTFSGTAAFLTGVKVSGTLSVGFLNIGGYSFGISLSQTVSSGQVLTWDGAKWVNATPGALAVGSATRSTAAIVVHGSASFSGKAVFKTALLNEGATTLSGNVRLNTNLDVSATASLGSLVVAGSATFAGPARFLGALDVSATVSTTNVIISGNASVSGTLSVGTLQIAGVTFTPGSYVTSASLVTAAYVTSNSMSARFASLSLDTIADVSLSLSVADGQVLTWNNTSNQWINASPAAASSATKTAGAFYNKGSLTQSGQAVFKSGVTFEGTVSFSATAVFTNMSVTSLGVTGTASFSATVLMANATISSNLTVTTINGSPPGVGGSSGYVQLGSLSFNNTTNGFIFSGSWSQYIAFDLIVYVKGSSLATTPSFAAYSDGGTTPYLQQLNGTTVSSGTNYLFNVQFINGTAIKYIRVSKNFAGTDAVNGTNTANTDFTNAIGMGFGTVASNTMSSGMALLFGVVGRT